ncbi:MAG: hypothetical protein HC860_21090 [Alkalinema sp. RU_4_3]|nr:hypothetical protein [Alkalinema sp. RU_4_3]
MINEGLAQQHVKLHQFDRAFTVMLLTYRSDERDDLLLTIAKGFAQNGQVTEVQ